MPKGRPVSAPETASHQIGEVAEAVGLSLRTIRYYEEVGLVTPSGRSSGGFRLYTDDDVDRLRLVKEMKPLDFSIDEIRDLLALRDRLAIVPRVRRADVDRLGLYADAAMRRCEALRTQLATAESLARTLQRDTTRARRRIDD